MILPCRVATLHSHSFHGCERCWYNAPASTNLPANIGYAPDAVHAGYLQVNLLLCMEDAVVILDSRVGYHISPRDTIKSKSRSSPLLLLMALS
jgi:hypothetical protein